MRKRNGRCLSVCIVMFALLCMSVGVLAEGWPGEPGEPIFLRVWSIITVPAGTDVEVGLRAHDYDYIYPDDCWDTLTFEYGNDGWPCPAPERDDEGEYSSECTVNFGGGTVKTYQATARDGACRWDDEDETDSAEVTWVGVGSISGPDAVCPDEWATFTATSDPAGHENMLSWSTEDDYGVPKTGGGGSFGIQWQLPGEHLVTFSCGTSEMSKVVKVLDSPPPCDGVACDGGSGGSCGGGGGFPTPGLRGPGVMVPLSGAIGGFGGFGFGSGGDGGRGDCRYEMPVPYSCGDGDTYYYDECGKCRVVNFDSPAYLGDGRELEQQIDESYELRDSQGNVKQYQAPPSGTGAVGYGRLTSVTDAAGRETEYIRYDNGALDKVVLPNGDTWDYETDPGDTKIRKVVAPDEATTVEVDYVVSGKAAEKVESVRIYDAPGGTRSLLSQTDYTYDTQGRLIQATTNGRTVIYQYDTNKITVTDQSASPQVVTVYDYGYDTTTVTRQHPTNPNLDQPTTYEYYMRDDRKTHLFKITDPEQNTTRYSTYVLPDTDVTGMTVEEDYRFTQDPDLVGKVYRITDALGRETDYTYDSDIGTLTEVTYPGSYTENYSYYTDSQSNKTWNLRTVKNVRGNYTHYVRPSGALWRVDAVKVSAPVGGGEPEDWGPISAIREYEYYPSDDPHDQDGLLKEETVPDIDDTEDQITQYEYWETVGGGEKVRPGPTKTKYRYWDDSSQSYLWATDGKAYDAMGNVVTATDHNSRSIAYEYDDLGRQTKTTYAPSVFTESSYDCCSLEWTKDEDGRRTYYAYDDAKRLADVWTNLPGQSQSDVLVHYDYDAFENTWKVTIYSDTGVPRVTEYTYDKNNRVVRIDYPSALGHEEFGYDAVGNLWWKKDGEGSVTLYRYDDLNRLSYVYYNYTGPLPPTSYPTQADVTYTYDGGSRLRESMTDSSGTTYYEYDERDRLTSYTPPQPLAHADILYAYNNLNQKTGLTSGGFGVSYDYYANGWLKGVSSGTAVADYKYDPVGIRTRVDYDNTTFTTYAYDSDPRYRTSSISHYRTGDPDVELEQISYSERDGAGNPLEMVDGSGTTDYTYDMNSRLDSADYPVQGLVDYNYDWVGNRDDPNALAFNNADQLTSWPGQHTYDYYGTGSLHRQYNSQAVLQKTYAYTGANLLASVTHAGVTNPSLNEWDTDGNRIEFTSSTGGAYTFVYDVTAGIPAVIEEETATSTVYYIREADGSLIARVEGSVSQYYHFDELGSTKLLTSAAGVVTDTYTYDAWGQVKSHSGSTNQPYQYVGQLGYYTHHQDANLDLLQLGVRFYDPEVGRFTQRDAIADDFDWYNYAANIPTMSVDPSGMKARGLTGEEWKKVNCHLRALAKCFCGPGRGRDRGRELLCYEFDKWKDRRGKFKYDPDFPENAETWFFGGWWRGMTFGAGRSSELGGCCSYNEELSVTLVHEFTHFDNKFWEGHWANLNAKCLNLFPGIEDPEVFHDVAGTTYVAGHEQCIRKEVQKCCK